MSCLSDKEKRELRKRLHNSSLKTNKSLSDDELKVEIEKEKERINAEQMKAL